MKTLMRMEGQMKMKRKASKPPRIPNKMEMQ